MGAKMGANTRIVCCALVLLLASGAWAAEKVEKKEKEPKKTTTAGTQTDPLKAPHITETFTTFLGISKEITALAQDNSFTAIGKECEGLKGEKNFVGKFKAGRYAVCVGSTPNALTKVQSVHIAPMSNCTLVLFFFTFTFHVIFWGAQNGGPAKAFVSSLGFIALLAYLEMQDAEFFLMAAALLFMAVAVTRPSFGTYVLLAFSVVVVEGYADLIPQCPYKSEIQHFLCAHACWACNLLMTMWVPVVSGFLMLATTGNAYGIITFMISAIFMNANQPIYANYAAITGIWLSLLLLCMPTDACIIGTCQGDDEAAAGENTEEAPAPEATASPTAAARSPAAPAGAPSAPQAGSPEVIKGTGPPTQAVRRASSGQSGPSGSSGAAYTGGARANYVSGSPAPAPASASTGGRGAVPLATAVPPSSSGSGSARGAKRPREGDADTPSKRPRQ